MVCGLEFLITCRRGDLGGPTESCIQTLLLVADEPDNKNAFHDYVRLNFYQVVCANNSPPGNQESMAFGKIASSFGSLFIAGEDLVDVLIIKRCAVGNF